MKTVISARFKMQTAWERASWGATGSEKYYVWRRALSIESGCSHVSAMRLAELHVIKTGVLQDFLQKASFSVIHPFNQFLWVVRIQIAIGQTSRMFIWWRLSMRYLAIGTESIHQDRDQEQQSWVLAAVYGFTVSAEKFLYSSWASCHYKLTQKRRLTTEPLWDFLLSWEPCTNCICETRTCHTASEAKRGAHCRASQRGAFPLQQLLLIADVPSSVRWPHIHQPPES